MQVPRSRLAGVLRKADGSGSATRPAATMHRSMRRVLQALEHVGRPWYITGSEALAAYASPRQTLDVDVVADLGADQLEALAARLRDCATLLRLNRGRFDRAYLDAWAERLGVSSLLRRVLEVSGAS